MAVLAKNERNGDRDRMIIKEQNMIYKIRFVKPACITRFLRNDIAEGKGVARIFTKIKKSKGL